MGRCGSGELRADRRFSRLGDRLCAKSGDRRPESAELKPGDGSSWLGSGEGSSG